MKFRIFLSALFLLANLLLSRQGLAQGTTTLHVTGMPGFPALPQDTVYEQLNYTFNITVANNTIDTVQNGLFVNMRVDSSISILLSSPATAMPPGDTTDFLVQGFNFTQPQFKAGNNIVVVWPVVNGMFFPIDSFYTSVFFVPISSLGSPDIEAQQLHLYPIPSSGQLYFNAGTGKTVEYVRIFTTEGKLVMESRLPDNSILDITSLRKGLYIIEAIIDGNTVRRKFIRE